MKQKPSSLPDPTFSEALPLYLELQDRARGTGGVVAASWGMLAADPRTVAKIMQEEDGIFDPRTSP